MVLRKILLPFTLSRLWVALFVYLAHSHRPFMGPVLGGWEGVPHWWLNPWTTYDSRWFVEIASQGYTPLTTTFFPLYPALLSLAGPDPIWIALWGIVLSNLAFLLGLYFLYQLTTLDYDESVASLSVWLLAFFPTTVFFSAVYSESLFFCLLVACLYAARRGAWGWAGLIGLLASLTRNSSIVIFLVLLLDYARVHHYQWRTMRPRELLALSLPAVGFALLQLFFALRFGEWLLSLSQQDTFLRRLAWPWEAVVKDLRTVVTLSELDPSSGFTLFVSALLFFGTTVLNVGGVLLAFGLTLWYRHRQPLSYSLLVLAILLMHLTYARINPPYTVSALRYLAATFPFTQLLAYGAHQLPPRPFIRLPLLLLYGLAGLLTAYLFGLKLFLG